MICYLFPKPTYFLFSSDVPALLYYAYIPITIVVLFIGFYVFWNNKHALLNKLFLIISILFSCWTISALIEWTNIHSDFILFIWNFQCIIFSLIAIFCIYFIYVFLNKEDISIRIKAVLLALLTPTFVFTPTFYLKGFDITNCDAFEFVWRPLEIYYTLLGVLAIIWIFILLIHKYHDTVNYNFRKQIILMGTGIEFFLFSFFFIIFLAAYLTQIGILSDSRLEMYGMLGMVIFMIYISILIVRFKTFNIKLLGVQVLVAGLVIITGSELFFANSTTNQILILISFIISFGFGYILVKSIKLEVQRKEELQVMTNKMAITNDKLRKLDNAKSEFISIASHQLRTPLTAIKGFVSLLLEGSYGEISKEVRETLNKVYLSNERLIELVEDLLNISRIESGRIEYKFEKVKLENICQEIMDTFVIRAKEKHLKIELKLPKKSLPEILTDKKKIREVISNLVDNALKYTPKGWVKISLLQVEDKVQIRVSDTGIGIPAEEIPHLFAKFSRGKDISRINTGGTGLGLYVGKKMIESLHGKIWVESKGVNLGSTFIIEIPIETKKEKAPEEEN